MMSATTTRLAFLQDMVSHTDTVLMHYFQKRTLSVTQKANTSPVSQADLVVEQAIRKAATEHYPDLTIVGEEYDNTVGHKDGLKLIIDPIDATANFVRGVPCFATLLAFEENGHITDGLVSAPAMQSQWWASIDQGAFYNGQPMQVSTITDLAEACVFHGSLYGYEATSLPPQIMSLLKCSKRQRGFGDFYAPMLVAMGCGEVCVDYNLQCWDMAPIQIIVNESGGRFSDCHNQPTIYSQHMICSNGHVHTRCLDILNQRG